MKRMAVVIPVYKEKLSHNEIISLAQVSKCLCDYDFFFLAPEGLENNYGYKEFSFLYFPHVYFESVNTYSSLMLKPDIYKMLIDYEYILIYQLDAFIFRSDIDVFFDKGYDYIGAPTIEGMYKPYRNEKVLFTQNGGFSLRRTEAFITWSQNNAEEIRLMEKFELEDSIIYALRNKGLKLASIEDALSFAFDSNVRECINRTGGKLPLGCHAWERYDYEFWKSHIENQGYVTEPCDPEKILSKDYYNTKKYNQKWIDNYDASQVDVILQGLLKNYDGKVYVWGMGYLGYFAMQLLLGADVEIVSFLDSNEEKVKKGFYPCKAKLIDEIFSKRPDYPIIVAIQDYLDACICLEGKGLHHKVEYITFSDVYTRLESKILSR